MSECDVLKDFNNDPLKRFFIYHISDENGLMVAYVPKGVNPNEIALQRGFINQYGEPEWYHVSEHPCLND